jgi:hypothetical protein
MMMMSEMVSCVVDCFVGIDVRGYDNSSTLLIVTSSYDINFKKEAQLANTSNDSINIY